VTVAANEGLSQTGLVERTGIDRSTLADIVRRMLKKGLLQRRRTREDARAYAVKLTDEGVRAMKSAESCAKRADDRILSALPARQREQMLDELAMLVEQLSRISTNGKDMR
jgi:DNA-binding MarR family transcriptional regulator